MNLIRQSIQSLAVLALHTHENVEMLIDLIQKIGQTGTIGVVAPDKPPKRGRF